ncbi:MAG: DUF2786 domain-containing protein [Candidatus Dojkabacteria bacterium]|nr:DUF2786 domain-containing protein [Candidatus Dojkabacteria bacterium]
MVMLSKEERLKLLDKLGKLLAHASSSSGNVNEMATANQKIKEITDEYGISLDEIKSIDDKNRDKFIEMVNINVYNDNPRMWARFLSGIIARFYDCRAIRTKGNFHFVGFSLDAEIVADIFNRLYYSINGAARMQSVNNNDFCFGAVISLEERLEEIKIAREKISSITALVVVKKAEVDKRVNILFPILTQGKGGRYYKSSDFYKGLTYGKTVQIFNSVEGENNVLDIKEPEKAYKKKVFKITKK